MFFKPSLSLRLVDSLSYEKETVTPTHEWLRVYVLVLSEENSTVTVFLNVCITHKVYETKSYVTLTLELTYYSS
jgi:hypothetical protein